MYRMEGIVFLEWTSGLDNGRMTRRPPFHYLVLRRSQETIRTTAGDQAYRHLLLRYSSAIPKLLCLGLILGLALVCIALGALGEHSGRLIVITLLLVALIPITIDALSVYSWFQRE